MGMGHRMWTVHLITKGKKRSQENREGIWNKVLNNIVQRLERWFKLPYVSVSKVIEVGKEYIKDRTKEGVLPYMALDEYIEMIMTIAVSGDISLFRMVKKELEKWIDRGMSDK